MASASRSSLLTQLDAALTSLLESPVGRTEYHDLLDIPRTKQSGILISVVVK